MVSFNKFFKSVFLAIALSSASVSAAPWPTNSKFATHRSHIIGRDVTIEAYHPESTYETYGAGLDHPLSKRQDASLEDSTKAFVASKLNIDQSSIAFKSGYSKKTGKVAYVKQSFNGIPVANAVANVGFNSADKVTSFGTSFVQSQNIAPAEPSISAQDAISAAEQKIGGSYNNFPTSLEYLVKQDGSAALTHVVQIQNEGAGIWVEAFVDAHSKEVLQVVNFVAQSSYHVLPITKQNPPDGLEILTNPADNTSSPLGWHNTGSGSDTTDTSGNNVLTYFSTTSNTAPQSASGQVFDYEPDFTAAPTTSANRNAAKVNTFYIVNTIHDFTYRYGFTEDAFNFQQTNNGNGGAGNDRVTVSVQDSAGTNNADFSTPADGQSGHMRMFLWTETSPQRDGALENDIVSHEMTHGVTNRMTGGGTGRCLQTTEAGGMGEGWSDAMAEWTEHKSEDVPDYVLGTWVINDDAGIRTHPYSTSSTTNPLTYGSIADLNEVHDIGEVWANMLHNVYAALVAQYGFSADAKTNPDGTEGNIVFLHLFLDALTLQPCNPTLPTARDAWIQADADRYDGANKCLLWKAFASRGLGQNAANHKDDSTVPSDC